MKKYAEALKLDYPILSDAGKKVATAYGVVTKDRRSEEHTSELQSRRNLVCRLLLEKKKEKSKKMPKH